MTSTLQGDTRVNGSLHVTGNLTGIDRTDLDTETTRRFELDLCAVREQATGDFFNHLKDDAGAGDGDLRMVGGAHGTNTPTIQSGDVMAAGLKTRYGRILYRMPNNYVDASPLTLRIRAGMKTTVADTSANLDVECFLANKEEGKHATQTGDMCTTAAQSMNSLTFADYDFVLTPTYVVANDLLDIRFNMAITDAASGTAVIGVVGTIAMLMNTKG